MEQLANLRVLMRDEARSVKIDALIVPSGDSHQSEYTASCDGRRAFISGFTGSAGTALILADRALLWTDGRYFLQASKELSAEWTLMKAGEPGVPDMESWLASNMKSGQNVGVDASVMTGSAAKVLSTKLHANGINLIPLGESLVDAVWVSRPAESTAPAIVHPIELAGESVSQKLTRVQEKIASSGADAMVFSMLDEIAWLFNIRGNDIEYNPLVKSYAIVTVARGAHLFIDGSKISSPAAVEALVGISIHPYGDIAVVLSEMARQGLKIAFDESQLNWHLCRVVNESMSLSGDDQSIRMTSPIAMLKSVKNEVELNGIRESHRRDGVALTAFLAWLDRTVKSGASLSECDAQDELEKFREKMPKHVSPSFATISGYGPNGAIIHYHATKDNCNQIGRDSLYLLDSGAQYFDGTTDVTRTVYFGAVTDRMKLCYTCVLKGHIALARAVFPEGTMGSRLDSLARLFLWEYGLDYNHGTGHGVGAFLNVHEGPQGIGFRARPNEVGFYPGMTTSNEPGYYEDGAFGIRIENICITVTADTPNNFANRKFCKFETVTLCPIETDLIDMSIITDDELKWLNEYHANVRDQLLPDMQAMFPEAVGYLMQKTEAVAHH